VLLITHHLDEAERVAHRIVVLAKGRIVAEGSPAAVADQARASGLEDAFISLTRVPA
jgi:ABC-2 type transport system ATP-binding protein